MNDHQPQVVERLATTCGPNGKRPREGTGMVTCYLRYTIDPYKLEEFEQYARMWIPLVNRYGGTHHGYFLPYEGANDIALALFSFPSLAEYEEYRRKSQDDERCKAAYNFAKETRCIMNYERSFLRPVLE